MEFTSGRICIHLIIQADRNNMNDIAGRIMKIVSEQMGVYSDQVAPDVHFIDDLGADSLNLVEVVMAIEDEFGISIPDDDVGKIATVQDAISYVETAQAGPGTRK